MFRKFVEAGECAEGPGMGLGCGRSGPCSLVGQVVAIAHGGWVEGLHGQPRARGVELPGKLEP